jgi:peptidoglycan/xylan/chitin deacetylase (PgdA/CDA1 family)
MSRKRILPLMYHDIRDDYDSRLSHRYQMESFIKPRTLEHHIEKLKIFDNVFDNFRTIMERDHLHRHVFMTFDDGLKDHVNILPILERHKVNATFFIPSYPMLERKMLHAHKIQYIIASSQNTASSMEIIRNKMEDIGYNYEEFFEIYSRSRFKKNKWSSGQIFVTNFLRNSDLDGLDRYKLTDELFKWFGFHEEEFIDDLYLNRDDIKLIASHGHTIGAHGHTSEALTNVDYKDDIRKSLEFIREFTDEDIPVSYPHGVYNEDIKKELALHNVQYAMTTNEGNIFKWEKSLEINRFDGTKYFK